MKFIEEISENNLGMFKRNVNNSLEQIFRRYWGKFTDVYITEIVEEIWNISGEVWGGGVGERIQKYFRAYFREHVNKMKGDFERFTYTVEKFMY